MATSVDAAQLAARIGRVVRQQRVAAGLSVSELARAAGLSKTILGRIEAGDGNPSLDTLWRVSQALHLPMGALIAEDAAPRVRRIAARSGEQLAGAGGMRTWLVHADAREHRTEVHELGFAAGAEQRTPPHLPGTEEVIVCLRGRLRVGPLGQEEELAAGDAVWFAADAEHRYLAVEDAAALCVMLYPPAVR
ncbi:MAG TPA: XRE family transcriptional regulator [Capillimicrobium sp.]|jgi:transcriptional regulator with XRE-family HTH domain